MKSPIPWKHFGFFEEVRENEPELASVVCLVRFDARGGSIIGTETTTRLRPLT